MPFNQVSETDRILIALTSLALNAPSTYTIAWSKDQHSEELPILYAGIATSIATVVGAIFGHEKWGNWLLWGGMIATFVLFGYVAFIYKPRSQPTAEQMLFIGGNGENRYKPVLIV